MTNKSYPFADYNYFFVRNGKQFCFLCITSQPDLHTKKAKTKAFITSLKKLPEQWPSEYANGRSAQMLFSW